MQNVTIVITGASSGIGAALAQFYASDNVTLGLLGRNEERLEEIASVCRSQGAVVHTASIDICNAQDMREWLLPFDSVHKIDLIIANAGISAGTGDALESEEQVRSIFAVNVDGVFNTILPVLPRMQARKHGQIAIMSSLAGIRALPSCPSYSASKAAVRYFGDGLREAVRKDGIAVSILCPGYIRTPMTARNHFYMPLMMSAERAALIIANGIARKKKRIAFPRRLYYPLWLLSCLPAWLTDPLFAALPKKGSINSL